MLGTVIILVILGLSSVNACASKFVFVVPGKNLRCIECLDNFGKCEINKMVECNAEAVNRTMQAYMPIFSKYKPGSPLDNYSVYYCHQNNFTIIGTNGDKTYIVRGCLDDRDFFLFTNSSFDPIIDFCQCSSDYCNWHDGMSSPNKFYNLPYDYNETRHEFCPKLP